MPEQAAALPSPLDAVAGPGLADALRDFLAPAAAAPGTPPAHKHWEHLARYLLEGCGFGRRPESWAALLCSRDFRGSWFREAAPYSPRLRVPVLFRMLQQAHKRGDGVRELERFSAGSDPSAWRLPDAAGNWGQDAPAPAFDASWYPATPDADLSVRYEDWFGGNDGFGRAMWWAMKAAEDELVDAKAISHSFTTRASLFSSEECVQAGAYGDELENSLRKRVAAWFREGGIPGPRASALTQHVAGRLVREFGAAAETAAAWIDLSESGRAYAAKFENSTFEEAAGLACAGDVRLAVAMASADAMKAAVPRLKALVATLLARTFQMKPRVARFVSEAGIERLRRAAALGGDDADQLRQFLAVADAARKGR
jgi:hypothetical protein